MLGGNPFFPSRDVYHDFQKILGIMIIITLNLTMLFIFMVTILYIYIHKIVTKGYYNQNLQ